MVAVPSGTYSLPLVDGAVAEVALDAFAIDRFEVTNSAYSECYSAGVCNWPVDGSSATRDEYFLDPQYARHPLLNITWDQARTYCQWRERRLPTQQEWQVAASYAPATSRFYDWPWGPAWEPAFVVGGDSFADTAAVGTRSPSGDSPLGAADMAGNVAEWTASEVAGAPQMAVVKGGSYADDPAELAPTAFENALKSASAPTLGFRCAR
jgi:formylglycine-generating enzyme required for sulfatase activity